MILMHQSMNKYLFTADDGMRVQHLHDLEVVDLHQIKWDNRFDEVVRNFIVAVVGPVRPDFQIRVVLIRTGIHHRCMATHIWATEIYKTIKTMHHFIRFGFE